MTQPDLPATSRGLTAEMMLRINRHCDRREAQWRATRMGSTATPNKSIQPISLRDFLETVPASDHVFTTPELILIDLAYLIQRQLPFSIESIQQQVPWIDLNWLKDQVSRSLVEQQLASPLSGDSKKQVSNPAQASSAIELTRELASGEPPLDASDVRELGDYLITGTIGQGGMGHVYRAVHKIMGRVVAIKTMQKSREDDLPARRRFEREVQVLAKLSHPNIVTAFDAREQDDVLYLVTELIEGEDLSKLVARKGPLRPRDAMFLIWQAAKGLSYAHQQGIIHRDIKPSNLILEKKRSVKVLDLGLARLQQVEIGGTNDSTLTDASRVLGTVRYMAPEQARSAMTADERSDIYSLGCTLYYLIVGQPPFVGETEIDTILAHVQDPIPELPTEIAGRPVTNGLRDLVKAMMSKLPEERPQSMKVVVEALEDLIRREQDKSSVDATITSDVIAPLLQIDQQPLFARILSWQRDRRQFLGWSLGAGTLAGLGGWYLWPRGNGNSDLDPLVGSHGKPIGLSFDGLTNHVEVLNFDRVAQAPFLVQLVATPSWQRNPANLISWTGRNWVALFLAENFRWGLAWLNQGRSRLVVCREPALREQQQLVAGWCDGSEMRMFINGREVATDPMEYEIVPTTPGLYIGGIPPKALPEWQGVRYYHGEILAVRIDVGNRQPAFAKSAAEVAVPNQHTLLCLPLHEGTGTTTDDISSNRFVARIDNAQWLSPNGNGVE